MVDTERERRKLSGTATLVEVDGLEEIGEAIENTELETLPFDRVVDRPPRVSGAIEIEAVTRAGLRRFVVRDISLTGLYIPGATAPVGREVPLRIPLPGEAAPIEVAARVVRRDTGPEKGLGLTFSRIGWEDLISLARYLAPRV